MNIIALSIALLMQVRTGAPTAEATQALAALSMADLQAALDDDTSKKTFWINVYNAYFQILATQDKLDRSLIFTEKRVPIAGHAFSLDEIEHGILRRYRWKWSLGYLPQLFPGRLLRQLAVDAVDYRIHFALNCGAKSCPPIAFYEADALNAQLDRATAGFLQAETSVDDTAKVVQVTALFQWFRADFGGRRGMRSIVAAALGKDLDGYRFHYQAYDWTAQLHHFVE